MQYYILPTNQDLIHWAKGKQAKQHKYVDRKMGKNGKWIYYYTTKPTSIKARLGVYAKEHYYNDIVPSYEQRQKYTKNRKEELQENANKWASGEYFDKEKHYDGPQKYLNNAPGNTLKEQADYTNMEINKQNALNRIKNERNAINEYDRRRGHETGMAQSAYLNSPIGMLDSATGSLKKVYNRGLEYLYNKLKIK